MDGTEVKEEMPEEGIEGERREEVLKDGNREEEIGDESRVEEIKDEGRGAVIGDESRGEEIGDEDKGEVIMDDSREDEIEDEDKEEKIENESKGEVNGDDDIGEAKEDMKEAGEGSLSSNNVQSLGWFQCHICPYTTYNKHSFTIHWRTHTGKKCYKCEECDEVFIRQDALTSHLIAQHNHVTKHGCVGCGKCFRSNFDLNRHKHKCKQAQSTADDSAISVVDSEVGPTTPCRFQCDLCPYATDDKYHLTRHQMTHTGEKPYECGQCGRRFSQKSNLVSHLYNPMKDHCKGLSSDERLSSHNEICDETESSRIAYDAATQDVGDTDLFPPVPFRFQCDVCPYATDGKYNFTRHHRTHTGEKPFTCEQCGKVFSQKSSLDKHLISHNKLPSTPCHQYECEGCGKMFRSNYLLIKHQLVCKKVLSDGTVDNAPTEIVAFAELTPCRYQCDACPYTTNDKSAFTIHQRIHTGEKPFRCELCGRGFSQRCGLNSHLISHDNHPDKHQCGGCGKSFRTNHHLNIHHCKGTTAPCKYLCDDCSYTTDKKDVFIRHRRIHTGERPYVCEECAASFMDKGNLTTHLIYHHGHPTKHQCKVCGKGFPRPSYLQRHLRICKIEND